LTADKVTGLRTEYDLDDGVPEYEVDFRQGDYEYDYTIHAETGKVLHWDKEFDPVDPKPTKPAEPQTPTTAPVKPEEPAPEKLTADDAKKIALDHAGLTADKVTGLRAKYDVDDGVPTYEVEFYADGWEYDYEIHAEIGKILEWDKDD